MLRHTPIRKADADDGVLAELPEGDFSLSDELITAQWFDEAEVGARLAGSSVAKLLFNDIKGAKL